MSSLKEIGNKAFNDLGISGTIIIPESVTKIGTSAFYRTRMDKLIFAAPIEDLSTDVFCDSYSLRELDLSIYTSLPDWLSQHLNLFSIEYPQGLPPTTVFVNQHMSDDDLDQ
ncbi:MAG: leucine-rich repeat domain-containing protein [Mycoplasmoidaceae bacterium]|nr:leucine-rich repeat domain-containing protein [Mycoplasmoidaceae bacterium]